MGATTNCHGFSHLQHLKGYFYSASNFQPNMYHQTLNHVGYINFKSIRFWSNSPRSLARFVPLLITILNTGSVKSHYCICIANHAEENVLTISWEQSDEMQFTFILKTRVPNYAHYCKHIAQYILSFSWNTWNCFATPIFNTRLN
jgi:hypothetical protein